jgi:hypothetical protein
MKYEKLNELLEENPKSSFEHQRCQKWYKRAVLKSAYEAIKVAGHEHEWAEIYKMLPSLFKIPKRKMELYCGKGTIAAYHTLFNELWHDKPWLNPFLLGGEIGSHFLENYLNQGRTMKRNPLQKEYSEWKEKMIQLYLWEESGHKLTPTSLSEKEIENLQTIMRFGPQDPHAGYYESDLKLVRSLKGMIASERRKALSYEGYIKCITENAGSPKKRFFTALNMLNVIVGTSANQINEQKRNIAIIGDLIVPKRHDQNLSNR